MPYITFGNMTRERYMDVHTSRTGMSNNHNAQI